MHFGLMDQMKCQLIELWSILLIWFNFNPRMDK